MRPLLIIATCWSLTFAVANAQDAKTTKAKPIESRGWNCFWAGGLIDGSCIGVKDKCAIIQTGDDKQVEVPLELFEAGEQKLICEHFGLDAPQVEPPDFGGGHPWHSSRGGVMVAGKITGRTGDILQVEDGKRRKFRVPFFLLASGAQDHAKNAVKELEGKPYDPKPPKETKTTARAKPQASSKSSSKPKKPEKPDVANANPPVETPKTTPPLPASPPPMPVLPAQPEPRGEVRAWKIRSGAVMAEGRFAALDGPVVRIVTKDGKPSQVPIDLLSDADRQYAETMAKGGEPSKAPKGALEVSADLPRFWPSQNGRSLLLIDGQTVHVLSADGNKKTASHELSGPVAAVAERDEYYVFAIGKELHLVDKKTFKTKKTHELWKCKRIRDVALHPTRRVAYVSVEGAIDDIRNNPDEAQRVLLVDEKSGDASEPGDVFASWVVVDRSGKHLFAGYRDVYQSGSDVRINGDGRLLETPNWENVDHLTRYSIEGDHLELDEVFKNSGANGQGLVLSPDGKRIVYLSFTGYPTFSGNVAALDATNFKKKSISFPMKERSDCKRLVFHPTLDLAASPSKDGAVIYSSTTGQPLEEALPESEALQDCAVHALSFAPDGKRLALVISKGGGAKYLQTAAIKVSTDESRKPQPEDSTASPPAEEEVAPRIWKDASGVFEVEATYLGRDKDKVVLKKEDGSEIKVPLAKLSDDDREWVAKQGR